MTEPAPIDWSVFDIHPESTCECACGAEWRTHGKFFANRGVVTRKPCPACGKNDNVRALRSDPELMTIGSR